MSVLSGRCEDMQKGEPVRAPLFLVRSGACFV